MSFFDWMQDCARIALQSEWIIDADLPDWKRWWEIGLTPKEAVNRFFQLIED